MSDYHGLYNGSTITLFSFFFVPQDGKTALHLAASSGHSESVAALILNGADVTAQDNVSFKPTFFFKLG